VNKKLIKQLPGIIITIFCLVTLSNQADLKGIILALKKSNLNWIFNGIIFLSIGYILRIYRWQKLLQVEQKKISWKDCASPYLKSITLNNCLPLRAGDFIRVFVFPKRMNIETSLSLNTIILERIFDLLIIAFMAIIGFSFNKEYKSEFLNISILLGISTIIFLPFINFFKDQFLQILSWTSNYYFLKKPSKFLIRTITNLQNFFKTNVLLNSFFSSIFVWLFESFLYYSILISLNNKISFNALLIVFSVITLSTIIPSTPGYIGTFHMAAYISSKTIGLSDDNALAFSILSHSIIWTFTTLPGLFLIIINTLIIQDEKI